MINILIYNIYIYICIIRLEMIETPSQTACSPPIVASSSPNWLAGGSRGGGRPPLGGAMPGDGGVLRSGVGSESSSPLGAAAGGER